YSFTTPSGPTYSNSDGAYPHGGLVASGNTLYGTAMYGGISGSGTVFRINTDGTGFTNIHNFDYDHEGRPFSGLVLSGDTLYGTAYYGGSSGAGAVFAINTNGTSFVTLHSFSAFPGDGAYPRAPLVLSDKTLFGTTIQGGSGSNGTVFAINKDGTGFTNLYNFTPRSVPYTGTNCDGSAPGG